MHQAMSNALAGVIMRHAGAYIGLFLRDWGFVWWGMQPPRDDKDHAFRIQCVRKYATAMGQAVVQGFLRTRHELEKDRIAHERHYSS